MHGAATACYGARQGPLLFGAFSTTGFVRHDPPRGQMERMCPAGALKGPAAEYTLRRLIELCDLVVLCATQHLKQDLHEALRASAMSWNAGAMWCWPAWRVSSATIPAQRFLRATAKGTNGVLLGSTARRPADPVDSFKPPTSAIAMQFRPLIGARLLDHGYHQYPGVTRCSISGGAIHQSSQIFQPYLQVLAMLSTPKIPASFAYPV